MIAPPCSIRDLDKHVRTGIECNRRQVIKEYNNTDKLHPNGAGYKVVADAVDFGLFGARAAAGK
jgi:hypothetical protein